MNDKEKYFNEIIKQIIDRIENRELDGAEVNENSVKSIIEEILASKKDKLSTFKISLSDIYKEVSKKRRGLKLEVPIRGINIVVYNKTLFKKINRILAEMVQIELSAKQEEFNLINDPLTLDKIMIHIFKFFKSFYEEKRTEGIKEGFVIVKDPEPQSNDREIGVKLEPPTKYKVIPDSIRFLNEQGEKEDIFSAKFLELPEKEFFQTFSLILRDEEITELDVEQRFLNFLTYFTNSKLIEKDVISDHKQGIIMSHIEKDKIYRCADILEKQENCMKDICEKIRHQFLQFTDSTIDRPKGIIFYGPPRTGKTFTTKKIIDNLKLFLIYPSLAAADFCHGLQGQSEKMVDSIAKRTEILPWQLCVLFIDEIDSLAPSRSNESTSNSQASMIGQFLAVIDGNKKKPNMLIMGTTNRLEKMDDAFVQRMDIKIFLGVPNTVIRGTWIEKKLREYERKKDSLFIQTSPFFYNLKNKWIGMTLNFTADAMKKSLNQIFIEFETDNELRAMVQDKKNDIKNILLKFVSSELEKHCIRDQIKFGKYILPKMITEIPENFGSDADFWELQEFLDFIHYSESQKDHLSNINVRFNRSITKRILVDLNTHCLEDQIQVEYDEKFSVDDYSKNAMRAAKARDEMKDYLETFKYQDNISREKFMKLFNEKMPKINDEKILGLKVSNKELFNENKANFFASLHKKHVLNYQKFGGLNSKSEVLKILIKMGLELQSDYILLLDGEYFYNKNFLSEDKIAVELVQSLNEVQKYDKSVIIFDLDSLLEVTKNRSQQKDNLLFSDAFAFKLDDQDVTFTESITRPLLMTIIMNFAESFLEIKSNHYIVFISANAKILMDFKEKTKWPKTPAAQRNIEKCSEILKERICKRCNEVFTEKDNNLGNCGMHSARDLYQESAFNFYVSKFNKKYENSENFLANEYANIINRNKKDYTTIQDEIRRNLIALSDVKWVCCRKGFYEKGEIPCKHEE